MSLLFVSSVYSVCYVFLFVCLSASYVYLSTLSVSLFCMSLLFVSSVYSVCSVFLFVCLSASYVYLSTLSASLLCMSLLFTSSVYSVFLLSALFSAPSDICLSVLPICLLSLLCVPALSVYSVCQPCRLCLFCLSALSVSNVCHPRPLPHPPNKSEFVVIRSRQYETRNNTTKIRVTHRGQG
jgi:hypothetical protein